MCTWRPFSVFPSAGCDDKWHFLFILKQFSCFPLKGQREQPHCFLASLKTYVQWTQLFISPSTRCSNKQLHIVFDLADANLGKCSSLVAMYHVTSLYWQLIAQGYAKLDCINLSTPGHGLDATNTGGAVWRLQRSKQGKYNKQMMGQAGPLVWAVSDSVHSITANSCYCSFVFHCVLSVCSFPYPSLLLHSEQKPSSTKTVK